MLEFSVNPSFEAEIRKEPEFKIAMLDAATSAKGYGNIFARESHAPWMPRRGHGQVVEVQQDEDSTYVVNTDYAGVFQEYGGRNNPPYAPLRRGVRAAGLELRESPKPV